ncbi:MAG: DUF2341 domain-containing protein, partial [Candidatus Omnitrophota bacterium]
MTDNTASGLNYGAVTVDGATKTLQFAGSASTFTFSTLTIGADDAVDINGENTTITTLDNSGTLKLQGGETVTITNMDTDSGTVEYTGNSSYTGLAAGDNYYNLTFSGTGVYTLDANLDINGNLTFTASGEFSYRKEITIVNTLVDANLTNFPILFSVTDTDLIDNVMSGSNYTIKFTNATGTELPYEVEYYNNTTGQLVAWVKADSLSSSVDTTLYLHYGSSGTASTENASGVWDADYMGVWHMDETSGALVDSTSSPNDGTAYGTVTRDIAGQVDGADSFLTDGYVDCGTDTSLDVTTGLLTVSAWIRQGASGDFKILGNQDNTAGGYKLGVYSNDKLEFEIRDASNTPYLNRDVTGGTTLTVDGTTWYYAVSTYSDSGDYIRTYINGSLDRELSSMTGVLGSTAGSFKIAREPFAASNYWNGRIDEVRVSDTVRPDGWISTEYNNQNAPGSFLSTAGQVAASATLNAGSYNLNIAGNYSNPGGVLTSAGTVTFDGASVQTLNSGGTSVGNDFNNITVSGSTVQLINNAIDIDGTLTINSGKVLDLNGQDLTLATLDNSGTLQLEGGETVAITTMDTDSGEVLYTGSGSYSDLAAGDNYYDLTFAGIGTYTLDAALDVNGSLTIAGYSYKKAIVLESDQVGGTADLTNFPVLFSVTDTDLRTTGNGGQVTDANGYDIIFVDSNGNQLDHEVESYTAASGQVIAWVKVPTLDYNDDTTVYVYYANSNITSSQENATGVWSNSYAAIYHLGEVGTGTAGDYQDSTSNSNDSVDTSVQPSQVVGKVGEYGQYFDGSEAIRVANASSLEPTSMTISCWFKRDGAQKDWTKIVHKGQGSSPFGSYILQLSDDATLAEFQIAKTTPAYVKASSATGAIADDTWYFLVGTYNGATGDGVLYVNTSSVDTFNDTVSLYYETTGLGIGGPGYDGYGDATIGAVDEVRISNTVRTQGWISTEYNNQNSPSTFYPTYASGSGQTAGNGVTLDAAGYSMNVGGNWSNSGTFTHSNNTVTFDGAAAQTITGANTWNNLTISNTHASPDDTNDVDPNAVQTVAGTLNITDGQWTPYTGDDYVDVTIGANGIMKPDSSASITVSGNWSNSGTFTHNSGTVTFDGSAAQTIT